MCVITEKSLYFANCYGRWNVSKIKVPGSSNSSLCVCCRCCNRKQWVTWVLISWCEIRTSMPFLFIRIHMTSMRAVPADVSISEYPAFFKRNAFQRCYNSSLPMVQFVWTVLVCCYITDTVSLNNAPCLPLHYAQRRHYNLSNVLPQLDRCINYGQVSLLGYS